MPRFAYPPPSSVKTGLCGLLTAIMLVMYSSVLSAQTTSDLDQGDKAYDKLLFEEALYHFELAHEQSPEDPAIMRRIANTYRRMGQLTMSAEWFRNTLNLDASNDLDLIYYAESLKSLEEYDEAIEWYARYAERAPNDKRAQSHLKDREYYLDLFADTLRYTMKRLAINTTDPVIGITHIDGSTYLLSAIGLDMNVQRTTEVEAYLDLFQVTLDEDNELIQPQKLPGSVNSRYHDGPAFYAKGNKTLYITRNNIKKGKPVLDKQGTANLKIYASHQKNGEWEVAEELSLNSNDYSSAHACLSRDGEFIYFASNKSGGYGGTDLYVAQRTATGWGIPVNLGAKVNTEGNEMFPFLSNDDVLYFTSDGHAGLGGSDIFVSERLAGQWQNPVNLGAPINSNHDDFNLFYNKQEDKGFFCSNRSGRGNDDIFFYAHKEIPRTIVAGIILPKDRNIPLSGERIRIVNSATGTTQEQRLSLDGKFNFLADPGDLLEIYMMNEQLFDPNDLILTVRITKPIIDPYMNVGAYEAEVRPLTLLTGSLRPAEGGTMSSGAVNVADVPAPSMRKTEHKAEAHELLNPVLTRNQTNKTDESSLLIDAEDIRRRKESSHRIENIHFNFNRSTIRDEDKPILDDVIAILNENPSYLLHIQAFCDSRGSKSYNIELSKSRASAAKKHFIQKGIHKNRIRIEWFGEDRLLNNCADKIPCSKEEHRVNRRAEITVY